MQRVTDQDGQMRKLSSSSDSADQTVDRQTAELNHLKQYVNVLQEKVDKLMGLTGELSDKFSAQMDKFFLTDIKRRYVLPGVSFATFVKNSSVSFDTKFLRKIWQV